MPDEIPFEFYRPDAAKKVSDGMGLDPEQERLIAESLGRVMQHGGP